MSAIRPVAKPPEYFASDLMSALLLAITGGILDAVVYLNHGHVFASSVTGNVIFLGISLTAHDWARAYHHMIPIASFVLGVISARLLELTPSRNGGRIVLAVEATALFVIDLLAQSIPQIAFVATTAFVSAFQVTTFRRVGRFTYNSTFVTGNLREVVDGWFDRVLLADPELRSEGGVKARALAIICTAFLLGSILGAYAAASFPSHSVLLAELPLLTTLVLTLRKSQRRVINPTCS